MVRIGETTGTVLEKTLLVTKVRTNRNEEMTIPNGAVLSNAVQNYSARAASGGLALTVTAGIGYDVDWRRIHELMIDAARRTEHILTEPAPLVLQTSLGDFAVTYEVRAWTDRADIMHVTSSNLHRNVLDAFNAAGIEIMTPNVLAHRDASVLAVPEERFPHRGPARGIVVDVNRSAPTG
jgi:small-conductance mechanosensitive channel